MLRSKNNVRIWLNKLLDEAAKQNVPQLILSVGLREGQFLIEATAPNTHFTFPPLLRDKKNKNQWSLESLLTERTGEAYWIGFQPESIQNRALSDCSRKAGPQLITDRYVYRESIDGSQRVILLLHHTFSANTHRKVEFRFLESTEGVENSK